MPRTISVALKAHFADTVLTICSLVKLTLKDSTVIGFTNLDVPVTYSSVTYNPNATVDVTAIHASADSGVDNFDITGIIDGIVVEAEDVRAGRYSGATIEVLRVNYKDLTQGHVTTFKGYIGQIRMIDEDSFQAEIISISQRLKQTSGDLTSSTCRVRRFGDNQCKLSLAGFTFSKTVDSLIGRDIVFAADAAASGYYDYGTVTFTTGPNTGLTREIKKHVLSSGKARITLRMDFPFPVVAGHVATLVRGCDRRFETCRDTYDNAINFRGEPHLPGNDKVLKMGRIPQG